MKFLLNLIFVRLRASVEFLEQSSVEEAEVSSLLVNNHMIDDSNT